MILFLFGTWGSGKSYVGDLIQKHCGLIHLEADIHFDKKMLGALHSRTFHELDLDPFYDRVITDIFNYQKRFPNFVVSQGIYYEKYRHLILDCFYPEIKFIWVKVDNIDEQKQRLRERAKTGNPIADDIYDYMAPYWEEPDIPHDILINDIQVVEHTQRMLNSWGLCMDWDD